LGALSGPIGTRRSSNQTPPPGENRFVDALHRSELEAFLRYVDYVDLPARPPALVYPTGLGLAVSGTANHCIVVPPLVEHQSVLVDFLGAGFSAAPEAFSYTLEDHAGGGFLSRGIAE
jgi:hypothetical protein